LDRNSLEYPRKTKLEQTEVICPEGLWVPQAGIRLLQKENPEGWGKLYETDAARCLINFLLVTPEMEAFSIDSYFGKKKPISRDYLRSSDAVPDFVRGFKSADDYNRRTAGKYFFLNKLQFEDFLVDKPFAKQAEIPTSVNFDLSYTPPYIEFMLTAAKELNLSAEIRINKREVTRWLEENWPIELGRKSDRMIQYMATFLRRPEDLKGGNTPWN
tara:strand:- start:7593 stop:8237 length:645 start_codon:yes stop_codon:yes gene_type:complete